MINDIFIESRVEKCSDCGRFHTRSYWQDAMGYFSTDESGDVERHDELPTTDDVDDYLQEVVMTGDDYLKELVFSVGSIVETWDACFADWDNSKELGVLFIGARKSGTKKLLSGFQLPDAVYQWLQLSRQSLSIYTCTEFKSLEALETESTNIKRIPSEMRSTRMYQFSVSIPPYGDRKIELTREAARKALKVSYAVN